MFTRPKVAGEEVEGSPERIFYEVEGITLLQVGVSICVCLLTVVLMPFSWENWLSCIQIELGSATA